MITQSLLPEFDHETANTRKTLERIPEDKFGWKPHEKSFALGSLSQHLATIPMWGMMTMVVDKLDIGNAPQPPKAETKAEILAMFDKNVADARAALAAASDEAYLQPWSLLMNGQNLFTMPRIAVYRSMVMNHIIHHRAQLGVYLRLLDVPVPSLYGPSADEQKF